MPDVTITIGGRSFEVACQEGEEPFLEAAANMLDTEASALIGQIGTLPESRMLLMAGLMLADKTAAMEDKVREVEARMGELQAELETLRENASQMPAAAVETLAEIARESEKIADRIEALASD